MSSLATIALRGARPTLRNAQIVARRQVHARGPDDHMPFTFSTCSRKAFAAKYVAFVGTGFAIPFIAIWWGWNRPGGLNNPL